MKHYISKENANMLDAEALEILIKDWEEYLYSNCYAVGPCSYNENRVCLYNSRDKQISEDFNCELELMEVYGFKIND